MMKLKMIKEKLNGLDVITCKVKYPPIDQLLSLDHVIPLLQECSSDDVSVCLKCAQLVSEWVGMLDILYFSRRTGV